MVAWPVRLVYTLRAMASSTPPPRPATSSREALRADYGHIRAATRGLCEPLSPEDYVVQSMPDASPAKWHLAHTSWFFETFVLSVALPGFTPHHPQYAVLFNSYYQVVGPQHPRAHRGLLTRPTVAEVMAYRSHVDDAMDRLFATLPEARFQRVAGAIELGLHHEEQHQELLLTDLSHLFAQNPLDPVYRPRAKPSEATGVPAGFTPGAAGGVVEIGATGERFSFDNEGPRHKVFVDAFELGSRLVTAGEYREFIEDRGYERADLWLSEGWSLTRSEGWRAPLYWRRDQGGWSMMTLAGRRPLAPDEPVCHVSFYEADAYARWAGARLPREEEWEVVAARSQLQGHFLEHGRFHPAPASSPPSATAPAQMFGDAWEWTASAYLPYSGFAPLPGALGEYNGKFMSGQMVLRGGSCATPQRHIRTTYRNYFPPAARWQFSGIRLAK